MTRRELKCDTDFRCHIIPLIPNITILAGSTQCLSVFLTSYDISASYYLEHVLQHRWDWSRLRHEHHPEDIHANMVVEYDF